MQRNSRCVYLVILIAVSISACKKSRFETITKELNLRGFNKLEIAGEFDIRVVQGAEYRVVITGSERDLAELDVKTFDQPLLIEYPDFRLWRTRGSITIRMPSLQDVVFAGVSNVTVEGFSETESVRVETSGESKLLLKMNAPLFQLRASNLSEITLHGVTGELEAEAAGSAVIDVYQSPVIKATVVANSQSIIKLHASQWLIATASGRSRIYYKGNPQHENLTILGNGQIIEEYRIIQRLSPGYLARLDK